MQCCIVKGVGFMEIGKELKKNGIKYSFSTDFMPMYKIDKMPIAIVNKDMAAGAEREVGDVAIGLLESVLTEGASSEERKSVLRLARKMAKYRNTNLQGGLDSILLATDELERDIKAGKIK